MYGNELFDYFCVGQEVDEDDMEFDYSSYGFIGRYDEDDDEEEEDDDDDDEVQFVENPIPTKTTTSSANSKPKQVSQPAQLVRRKLWPEDYYYQLLKWLPKDVSLNDRAAIGLPTDIQSNPYKFANMASYYEFWSDFAIEETRASITNGMRAPDMVDDPYLTDRNQSIELVHVSSSHFATEAMVADQKSEFVYNVRFRVLKKSYCSDLDKLSMTASVFSFRLGGVVKKRKDTSDDRHDYATDEIIFGAISSGFKDNSSGLDKEKGELFVSIIFAGDKYRQLLDAYFQLKEGQIVSATYVCNVLLYHRLFITCAAKPGPACITSLLGESAQNVNGTSVNNNLYPTNTVGRSGLELAQSVDCWTQLNQRQRDSIVHCMNSVLRNPGSLSLVQGPPGCGKSFE